MWEWGEWDEYRGKANKGYIIDSLWVTEAQYHWDSLRIHMYIMVLELPFLRTGWSVNLPTPNPHCLTPLGLTPLYLWMEWATSYGFRENSKAEQLKDSVVDVMGSRQHSWELFTVATAKRAKEMWNRVQNGMCLVYRSHHPNKELWPKQGTLCHWLFPVVASFSL